MKERDQCSEDDVSLRMRAAVREMGGRVNLRSDRSMPTDRRLGLLPLLVFPSPRITVPRIATRRKRHCVHAKCCQIQTHRHPMILPPTLPLVCFQQPMHTSLHISFWIYTSAPPDKFRPNSSCTNFRSYHLLPSCAPMLVAANPSNVMRSRRPSASV